MTGTTTTSGLAADLPPSLFVQPFRRGLSTVRVWCYPIFNSAHAAAARLLLHACGPPADNDIGDRRAEPSAAQAAQRCPHDRQANRNGRVFMRTAMDGLLRGIPFHSSLRLSPQIVACKALVL